MMNKTLAFIGAAMISVSAANAQSMKMYTGVAFHKASPDGNWLIENLQGTMSILNAKTGEKYEVADPNGIMLYSPGLGNSVTNNGKVFGFTSDRILVWDNGTIKELDDEPTGVGTGYNSVMAVTPDEKFLVGALGPDGASSSSNGMMAIPTIWEKNSEGKYVSSILPYPKRDFAGETPQSIVPQQISDDGNTIVGTLTSGSGFYTFPYMYNKPAGGDWIPTLLGVENIYDESKLSTLPEVPVEPTEPNKYDYMTEDDKKNYDEAYMEYEELLEMYQNGIISKEPTAPNPTDYMSDADKKAAYVADIQKYVADHNAYIQAWQKYSNALQKIVTGNYFRKNNMFLSANGRYLATTLLHNGISTPGYFDLTEEKPKFVAAADNSYSMTVTSVLNDGTIIGASPVDELTRSTYVIKKGEKPMTFHDYLATRNEAAAKWLADNNTYKVTIYGDDGETVIGTKNDSIVSGTVTASPDGMVFVSYYTDYYTDENQTTKSFVINLNSSTAIDNAVADEKGSMSFKTVGNSILFTGTKNAEIYDLTGRLVAKTNNDTATLTEPGIYVVSMKGMNGLRKSQKVVIK